MPYIGNTVQNQGFAPAIDYFSGNGVTVTFTLSRPVASVAQMIVAIDNVIQNPSSAFSVAGNSITFTSAPLSGTNNIWVEYTSLITTYAAISQDPTVIGDITATGGYLSSGDFGNSFIDGTVVDYVTGRGRVTVGELDDITFYHGGTAGRSAMMDLYYAGGAKIYGTTALTIPVGTTAQRPGTPALGMHRMNTTTGFAEYWNGSAWIVYGSASPPSVEYVVVAGGGGGAGSGSCCVGAGGAGAGGYRSSVTGESSGGGAAAEAALVVTPGSSYTVTIGAGGSGASGGASAAGSNSVFASITSLGGGGGGNYQNGNSTTGGSGGGACFFSPGTTYPNPGLAGTAGQGYAGGNDLSNVFPSIGGGGGGGAGAVGGVCTSSLPANGGIGVQTSISGTPTYYAGGGGAGVRCNLGSALAGGTGGLGGGGTGSSSGGSGQTSGGANTGGGGGGGVGGINVNGFTQGGSGIVIIRYPSVYKDATATGTFSKTSSGGYTIYTFTGSGTISF